MKQYKTKRNVLIGIMICSVTLAFLYSPIVMAGQRCFKCCGSGIWHVDNKIPCSGEKCRYCIKCNGCGGSGQISDTAERCNKCNGLGQIHSGRKMCTRAGCAGCSSCKSCNTKGWVDR
ncbi:MAG: hypothetical protein MRJ65_05285 [Candidatus Brocadiaceae bacterium]|nr:hypothetical protein [Candidatus Brocadiaceae bacterium]